MKIAVRAARIEDAPVIVEFNAALAWESEQLRLEPATLDRGVRAGLSDPAKARYFVAELGGRVVGQLMLTLEWSDWRDGEIWWIQSVYVHHEFRRAGVFTAIYRHVEQLAKDQHAAGLRLYVVLGNGTAQKTYERLGMMRSEYVVMENLWRH